MSGLRELVKRTLPRRVWGAGRDLFLAGRYALAWPAAALHPWGRASLRRLAALKNIHRGERAFIVGNGPSLNNMDLSKLQGEQSFGMNRVYLGFKGWGFETSFFVSVNDLVVQQSAAEIQSLSMPKFLSWRARRWIQMDEDTIFLFSTYERPKFSEDVRSRVWEGATVTYVALQLAYFMGFDPVILIGVDHNFQSKGAPNTTVVSLGDDPNHFVAGYFGEGFRWQLPDLEMSERAYAMAKEAFESDGRRVLDATVGGKLQVFPKVNYDTLF